MLNAVKMLRLIMHLSLIDADQDVINDIAECGLHGMSGTILKVAVVW